MSKIIFMGTPDFAVPALQALIETQTVVGVVTQPDKPAGRGKQLRPSPVKVAALAHNIPVYQPKSLRTEEAAAPLRQWQPDLIVVAAFGQILRPHVLNLPPHGCLNVHASLLPRWRGASPIQHAIMAGDAETGVTLMQMDEGLDTGPMFVKEAVPIAADETAASLHDKLAQLGAHMLRRYLDDILAGRITPQPQDDSASTYAPMIRKEMGLLDWTQTAVSLDRHIRAMTPWPGAFTYWQGALLKIITAVPVTDSSGTPPGYVFMQDGKLLVATGSGALQIETLQLAGKRAMSGQEFVNGRADIVGAQLGQEG
ncbi:MAG: methionyl-tRNA formyltransferase [Candidatus Promineifilaceae bacterium]